jgi:hypothetical protein
MQFPRRMEPCELILTSAPEKNLNSLLKHHPSLIPKIGDIIWSIEGNTFATALDFNMGYYHIKLDYDAQKLCTTVFP